MYIDPMQLHGSDSTFVVCTKALVTTKILYQAGIAQLGPNVWVNMAWYIWNEHLNMSESQDINTAFPGNIGYFTRGKQNHRKLMHPSKSWNKINEVHEKYT